MSRRPTRHRLVNLAHSSVPAKSITVLARILLLILVIVYWAAGWATGHFPLQWSFPFVAYENAVEKTPAGGFSFPQRGIAYTETAPDWINAAIRSNTFEVQLEARPYSAHQSGPARIFTVSSDFLNGNFTIGQADGSDLVIRLRTPATSPNGSPGYRVRNVFDDLAFHRIVVRVEPNRIRIELDGRQLPTATLPPNALSTWNPRYRLALGNEFTFNNPWRGEITQAIVRVRDAEFSYAPAGLRAPNRYFIDTQPYLDKLIDAVSGLFYHFGLRNFAINLVGFLPFGLLLAFVARKPFSLAVACAWCALMSLSIEAGQVFLDARYTSIVDLLSNTTGGCIGAWMGNRMRLFSTGR